MRKLSLLLVVMFVQSASADEFLNKSDDELVHYHQMHPETGCMFWRHEARHFHKLLPQDSPFPDEVRHELLKKGHGLAGKYKEPETSVNYILKKKMFDMTVARSAPADTEVAVYEQCMKYEPEFTFPMQAGGHDPDPKLRSRNSTE